MGTKRIKILINTYPLIFQNIGGIQKRVIEHKNKLLENNIKAQVFEPNVKIRDFDILTTFKPQYGNYDVFLEAKKLKMKTVTHVIHEYQKSPNKLSMWKNKLKSSLPSMAGHMQRIIIESSDIIIATSETERALIQSNYRVSKNCIKIVPNSVNVEIFMRDYGSLFTDKYNIQPPFVLMVGRIEKNKNQLAVIKAISQDNTKVVIIGKPGNDKSYYDEVKAYQNCHIISDIEYSSPELASAYRQASVFILPSLYEISPNAIIEAVLSNTNVISTANTVSIRSYFGDDITYINPKDVEGIRYEINRFLRHGAKNHYLLDEVSNKFNSNTIINQHLNIYKTLMQR